MADPEAVPWDGPVPRHVAIIMDGNGRWAQKRGLPRSAGHEAGAQSVRKIVRACGRHGVEVLTLYSFSTENWSRPEDEVAALMGLLEHYLDVEIEELHRNGIRLRAMGRLERLPDAARTKLEAAVARTADNTEMTVLFALSYGGRAEIADAARRIARDAEQGKLDPDSIDEKTFAGYLYEPELPGAALAEWPE